MSEAKYWEEREAAKAKALKLAAKAEVELSEEERIAARMAEEVARMEKAIEGMSPDEVYGYCRKLEDDRIRKHFSTDTGKLENKTFRSLDQHLDSMDDENDFICSWLDDNGVGRDKILRADGDNTIAHALSCLHQEQRTFAEDVLNGKSWEDLGIPKRTFNWRLKKLEDFFFNCCPPPSKPSLY